MKRGNRGPHSGRLELRDANGPWEVGLLWQQWAEYMERDILPHCDPPVSEAEAAYLMSRARREQLEKHMARAEDRLHFAFLTEDGGRVGFVQYVIYHSEDGKCVILDYCIDPVHRGRGLGARMFAAAERQLRGRGAMYFALNTSNPRNRRFWTRLGFAEDKGYAWSEGVWVKQ